MTAGRLAEAGCATVGDLLRHLPFRYEDRRCVLTVAEALARFREAGGEVAVPVTLRGSFRSLQPVRVRRRGLTLVRGTFDDGSGQLTALWFNRPYLTRQISTGSEVLLHGPLKPPKRGERPELVNPSCEDAAKALEAARVLPVYPTLGGLGPAAVRRLLDAALAGLDLTSPASPVAEPLPETLRRRHGLPALGEALAHLHAPPPDADAARLAARRSPAHLRLIYGELLELQLALALVRERRARTPKAHRYRVDDQVRRVARQVLPFRLTGAQRRALREIAEDLQGAEPMLRLVQGDVGSGKTIVAALALVLALESGLQGAFMAPTELLAEQHFRGLLRLLGGRYRVGLFTGSNPDTPRLVERLAKGEIHLAVGTHALIQKGVTFRNLGLAVIDEQHRFGVLQRQLLQRKGEEAGGSEGRPAEGEGDESGDERPVQGTLPVAEEAGEGGEEGTGKGPAPGAVPRPDVLVMTATPIPRSLALTVYGDLALSVIDELPPGRTPVATRAVPAAERRKVYHRLARALADGERAYVVFPLIEASDALDAACLEGEGEEVRRWLGEDLGAGVAAAVLHGKVGAEERERIMAAFAAGEVQVLLATTVIEVGVDVPEATWMVIESAERFGLAQLHQLRGRVGRGERPSRCVAIHGASTDEGRRRLEVFTATTDGFRIAEEDLAIRGPGDLLGTRQAGLPTFRVADLAADWDWLVKARDDAPGLLETLETDPDLAPLKRRVEALVRERLEVR